MEMTIKDFRSEYEGSFPTHDDHLDQLAEEYAQRCEAYDRGVCSGRRYGEAIPMTPEERMLIERHAVAVFKEIKERGGYTTEELRRAVGHYMQRSKSHE